MESTEQNKKNAEIWLISLLKDYSAMKENETKRKKLQSDRNKRYYQGHRAEILTRNREMKEIYRRIKQI